MSESRRTTRYIGVRDQRNYAKGELRLTLN